MRAAAASSEVATSTPSPGIDPYYTLYQGALGASWQIDLFGRVRRQTEAAQARVYATEQGRRGVVLSVVTSVAASYIVLRALDRQLEISQQTAKNYANTLRIFELAPQGRRGVEARARASAVAVPAGARGDSVARAAHRGAGEPDRRAAGQESLPDSARQEHRRARRCPAFRRTCRRRCSNAAPTSCRPSRTSSRRTPTSAPPARSTTRSYP